MLVVVREPSGRRSRAASAMDPRGVGPAEAKRLRDAAARGMADPEWGTELGRLFLAGEIDEIEYAAGRRWERVTAAYQIAIGAKAPHPAAQSFERVDPSADPAEGSDEAERQARRAKRAIADWQEAHGVLIGAGMLAERAVRAVCEHDDASIGGVGIAALSRGLSWLGQFWNLTEQGRKRNGRSRR